MSKHKAKKFNKHTTYWKTTKTRSAWKNYKNFPKHWKVFKTLTISSVTIRNLKIANENSWNWKGRWSNHPYNLVPRSRGGLTNWLKIKDRSFRKPPCQLCCRWENSTNDAKSLSFKSTRGKWNCQNVPLSRLSRLRAKAGRHPDPPIFLLRCISGSLRHLFTKKRRQSFHLNRICQRLSIKIRKLPVST